jgi:hypothetical protein
MERPVLGVHVEFCSHLRIFLPRQREHTDPVHSHILLSVYSREYDQFDPHYHLVFIGANHSIQLEQKVLGKEHRVENKRFSRKCKFNQRLKILLNTTVLQAWHQIQQDYLYYKWYHSTLFIIYMVFVVFCHSCW